MDKNDKNNFSKFLKKHNFDFDSIEEIKNKLFLNNKQLIKSSFKYLSNEIEIIGKNFNYNFHIENCIDLIKVLCESEEFSEEEIIINKKRIKKARLELLSYIEKYKNYDLLDAANKLDEIVLDKNINVNDLIILIKELIKRKEDVNIIKKLLSTNKGVIALNKNELFDHAFNLALSALKNEDYTIYYYITLLKIFYSSSIEKKDYIIKLNNTGKNNLFSNEIYLIINGDKKGLSKEEILKKYCINKSLPSCNLILPNKIKTDVIAFTIDSKSTLLRDDAISLNVDGDKYILGIHIADPSYSIPINSIIDEAAMNNFKCCYMPGYKTRIFNRTIETDLSLNKNCYRNTLSMYVTLDKNFEILDYIIKPDVIKIYENFSHAESDAILNGYNHELRETLQTAYDIACYLDIKNPKKRAYWEKKEAANVYFEYDDSKSQKIVNEFAVLYDYFFALLSKNQGIPFIYRTQCEDYIPSLIKEHNIQLDDSLKKVLQSIYYTSKFTDIPSFHNGLNLPVYAQVTDPLRRFTDHYDQLLYHNFIAKDINMKFDYDEMLKLIKYFNERNSELQLMKSEYTRAIKNKRN